MKLLLLVPVFGLALVTAPNACALTQGEVAYINDMTAAGMGPPVNVPMFLGEGYRVCGDIRSGVGIAAETASDPQSPRSWCESRLLISVQTNSKVAANEETILRTNLTFRSRPTT